MSAYIKVEEASQLTGDSELKSLLHDAAEVLQAEEAYKTSPTGDSLLTYMDKLSDFKKKWFFDHISKEGESHEG